MDDKPIEHEVTGLNRRRFIGALGAVASAAMLPESAQASCASVNYLDSFENIVAAASDTVAAGVMPPPTTGGTGTYVTPGYSQPNVLMIMVDQLRWPRWLPSGGQAAIDAALPNLARLRDHSFVFPNYFVAATNCSPSRATLLTGLYSQQTCMFATQDPGSPYPPSLQTGYPTFANALAQSFVGYDTAWLGKWHLSCNPNEPAGNPGGAGPSAYGFTDPLCIPTSSASNPYGFGFPYPSPNGMKNEGNGGDFLSGSVSGYPATFTGPSGLTAPTSYLQLNDPAIAQSFTSVWLTHYAENQLNKNPDFHWFCAVSFVNPHDMSGFPFSFDLAGTPGFGAATSPSHAGYQPPPPAGYPSQHIPSLSSASVYGSSAPAPWNNNDDPLSQPYGTFVAGKGWGKPGLQAFFENQMIANTGQMLGTPGWVTFLNYYIWMQSCVDYWIGQVISALQGSPFWGNTIIMFHSDHGDFAGSHNLHAKGGGLYDEIMNVPLYVSFPPMRTNYNTAGDNTSITRNFVCSSVDVFGFLYSVALGNDSWRWNTSDPYNYLIGREALDDAIYSCAPAQRRLSAIANSNGIGFQPFILHTTDEFPGATVDRVCHPSHAIAFRTVDLTANSTTGCPLSGGCFGGGKLGVYSYWNPNSTSYPPTQPIPAALQETEFYNYTTGNYGEFGNQAFLSSGAYQPQAMPWVNGFASSTVQNELYLVPSQVSTAYSAALAAYQTYWNGQGGKCQP